MSKPVGAIISGSSGGSQGKVDALKAVGVRIGEVRRVDEGQGDRQTVGN